MSEWPEFDFETDGMCQSMFKPFILKEMDLLAEFDAQRPAGITYIFHQHAERVAHDVEKTCLSMGLSKNVARNMYWATLPHDCGKRMLPVSIWDQEDKPDGELKRLRRTHTELGAQIVEDELGDVAHPFKTLMTEIILNHHEQMDGEGYRGLSAEQLSMPVRLAAIVEAFDGWSISRPHYGGRDITIPAVLKRMREEKAEHFDEKLLKAFTEMKTEEYNRLEGPGL
ncbi:MAG: HD domain-containing protein [Alphaproteobacteria bacterium PRO2]|nr:HD domain-containing protein [Alphaproteobacteria bacterium PRO2]